MQDFDFSTGEILFIDKPYKWTSFDVVNKIRSLIKYQLGIKKLKLGHAGTLDPLATGLLILCTGKFTKRIDEFQGMEKEYTGTFMLGATTPSFDLEKEIDNTFDISEITEQQILDASKMFVGNIKQVPPVFSAKKINGERAYEFARKGIDVLMEAKEVSISEFEITRIALPEISFRIVCSKGTYIRSLARDLGLELNNGAYLSELKRTRIGEFSLDQALSLEQIEEAIVQQKNRFVVKSE
jgi:tRNA pseudouridine55 synthase